MIDGRTIEQVKALPIESVIERYAEIKRSGSSYVTLCPFHADKKPSLSLSPAKNCFKCFSCGAAGDSIAFVMKVKRLEFAEAVEEIAGQFGIEVIYTKDRMQPEERQAQRTKRERMLYANKLAAEHWQATLFGEAGLEALGYLRGRGFTDETIQAWGLGFAVDMRTDLLGAISAAAKDPQAGRQAGIDAGLFREIDGGGAIDRFRNRIIFPIQDHRGHLVGFGGRILPGKQTEAPKYLNTSDTDLFHKGTLLYGLNRIERPQEGAVIVEGYTDVIAMHQAGLKSAVATLGTALTPEHIELLRRMAGGKAIAFFDNDQAGDAAWRRARDLSLSMAFDLRRAMRVRRCA